MTGLRGQNMVLLSLTMLVVTLMVLVTLGLSQRIRDNHELNNLADVSAYSSAVVNARAFNDVALLNRLQVSYWVSMAANESLISWTSYTRALWSATRGVLLSAAINETGPRPDCKEMNDDIAQIEGLIKNDFMAYVAGWRDADNAAGKETRDIQDVISGLRQETRGNPPLGYPDGVRERLFQERAQQNVVSALVARSGLRDVTVAGSGNVGASYVSGREVGSFGLDNLTDCVSPQTGLCQDGQWSWNIVNAAMGSRGNPFVTGRGVLPPVIQAEWNRITAPNPPVANPGRYHNSQYVVAGGVPLGSAYWAGSLTHASQVDLTFAWGDDHGTLNGSASHKRCSGVATSVPVTAHVKTTDLDDLSDEHVWDPRSPDLEGSDTQADVYHTVGSCVPFCPSVWVRSVTFLPDVPSLDPDAAKDAYGQPKVEVMLVRDTSLTTARTNPWELNFKFGFTSAGSAFDNRGRVLHHNSVGADLAIGSQSALATGMAYYHRKDTWLEFPNLLNPFWRATLVPADIDKGGKARADDDDVDTVLNARPSEAWQGAAYDALVAAGFKGLH
jgi:hypothetical protein